MAENIGRYRIEQELGHGALGRVYLAFDPKLGRRVAVKVLATEVSTPSVRERFRREAQAIATLKHPNIVQLYDYSDDDSPVLYLVMEHVEGRSLRGMIESRGPVSEQVALCIGHELSLALAFAHEHKVVHRDVKPENVIMNEGRVVLVDFGSIKVVSASEAMGLETVQDTTQAVGTPGFMAPEQFLGKDINPRTDIFALGALLYNITTDALPYHDDNLEEVEAMYRAVKQGQYRDPRDFQPLLTLEFVDLLRDCLARRPNQRVPDVTIVAERIAEILEGHGITRIQEELSRFVAQPDETESEQQTRSVETLIRELKSALLRDLQAALKQRNNTRTRRILAQYHHVAPMSEQNAALQQPAKRAAANGQTLFHSWQAWFIAGGLLGLIFAFVVALLSRWLLT